MRQVRSSWVVRLAVLLLGLGIAAPATASATDAASQSKATRTQTSTKKKKSTYSSRASKARKARLARARAAARAREQKRLRALHDLMTPRYKRDEATGAMIPDVRAAAAIVFDPETGEVLYEENSQDTRSIASITKVMTALVFLEDNPNLDDEVTVQRSDVHAASLTYLRSKDRITKGELLHLMLIASDNAAARALARSSHGGMDPFIARMNEKALELGLQSTRFADPSGLDSGNVSSAYDLSRLITFAAGDHRISEIMRTPTYAVTTSRRTIQIHSTNRLLLGGDVDVMGGKTGFISKAGYCLATLLRLPQGNPVAVVVLGAQSNLGRFWETRHLFNWLNDKAGELVGKDAKDDQQ